MVCQHEILSATASMYREAAYVVGVDFSRGITCRWTFLLGMASRGLVMFLGMGGAVREGLYLSLVDWIPWRVWVIFPLVVSSASGNYLAALSWERPFQVE